MRIQRLRATFGRGAELRFITHLDLMRFWERAFRRAGIAVAYSEGFSPHPQISLAAPLPVGITARAELMDVFLAERLDPESFLRALEAQLPAGLTLEAAEEVGLGLPSIQSQLRAAEYCVRLPSDIDVASLELRLAELLDRETIPWQHRREKEVRSYDLRPLIQHLSLQQTPKEAALLMRLRADNAAAGRPDQVLAALELPARCATERTRLILAVEPDADAAVLADNGYPGSTGIGQR